MAFIKFRGVIDEEKEEKYKRLNKKRKIKKICSNILKSIMGMVILCILFFGLVELDSIICKVINNFNLMYNDNYFDICNTIFGIQSTITTLTIAFVSIFSGMIKEKIYGIYITEYIMKIKNKKLNIYNLSMLLFVLSLIYFGLLTECAYIMCCFIFVISTVSIMYIMRVVFNIVVDYDIITQEVEHYIMGLLVDSVSNINYDGNEDNIRYILEENIDIKDLHSKSEKILNNLYNDTIEKINIDDYNNYSQNVKIIERIFFKYNCANMNLIQKDIFETIMQTYDALIDIFINRQKYQLAVGMLEYISDKIQFGIQRPTMKIEGKQHFIDFLNIDEYILRLCNCLEKQYSYNDRLTHSIINLIKNKQFYYLIYMDINISKEEYDCDFVFNSISKLLGAYILCVKGNKYWTDKEKEKALRCVSEYNDTYMKNGSFWGIFLDYYSYLFVKYDSNNNLIEEVNKEDTLYIAMKKEIERIKSNLNIFIKRIME